MGAKMNDALEKYKILLEDARQTYYSRLGHYGNLATKAGIILAVIIGFVALIFDWLGDPKNPLGFKLTVLLFLSYATYLGIRAMFTKKVQFVSIDVGLRNLAGYPRMKTLEWVKFLINQYKGFIKELHADFDAKNDLLKQSLYFIGGSVIVYLISLVVK
jgi:hypothetical protein